MHEPLHEEQEESRCGAERYEDLEEGPGRCMVADPYMSDCG